MSRVDVVDLVVDLVDGDLDVDLFDVDLDVDLVDVDLVDVDLADVDLADIGLVDVYPVVIGVDLDRITRKECFRLPSLEKCCTTS